MFPTNLYRRIHDRLFAILIIILQLIFLEGILSIDNAAVIGAFVSSLPDDQHVVWPRPFQRIGEHFMAVNEKGAVVGVAKLYAKDEHTGHSSHLAVAPEYQQKGVGRLLLETVEQRARARGFHTVGTMARVTATDYFEKYGFRIAGIPTPHLGTIHLVWMEKALD